MAISNEAIPQVQSTETQTIRGALKALVDVLNGPAHERVLYVYMVIVLLHWMEHIVQAYQIYVLGWPRAAAGGVLGLWLPWLLKTELLHWGYAFAMLAGLILLLPGFIGRSRTWWIVSLVIQTWHFFEHSLLQAQAIMGHNLFGASVPTSVVQLWIPRVELHLIYNAAVFIPMVIAMYYHLYPPVNEPPVACTCSRRTAHEMA